MWGAASMPSGRSKRILLPFTVRVIGGTGRRSLADFATMVMSPSKSASDVGAAAVSGAALPAALAACGSLFLLHEATSTMAENRTVERALAKMRVVMGASSVVFRQRRAPGCGRGA